MSKFLRLEANSPATLGAVVEAVARRSSYSDAQILELVSARKIQNRIPIRLNGPDEFPPDKIEERDLVEASATPLSRLERAALIQSSTPTSSKASSVAADTSGVRRSNKKT